MAIVVGLNRMIASLVARPVVEPNVTAAKAVTRPIPQPQRDFPEELRRKPYLDYSGNPEAVHQHLREIAQQSRGDVTRISSEDRAWLDKMSMGHAAEMLRMTEAERLRKEAGSRKTSGGGGVVKR